MIATEGHQLAEEKAVVAAAVCRKAVLEAEVMCKAEVK